MRSWALWVLQVWSLAWVFEIWKLSRFIHVQRSIRIVCVIRYLFFLILITSGWVIRQPITTGWGSRTGYDGDGEDFFIGGLANYAGSMNLIWRKAVHVMIASHQCFVKVILAIRLLHLKGCMSTGTCRILASGWLAYTFGWVTNSVWASLIWRI